VVAVVLPLVGPLLVVVALLLKRRPRLKRRRKRRRSRMMIWASVSSTKRGLKRLGEKELVENYAEFGVDDTKGLDGLDGLDRLDLWKELCVQAYSWSLSR
jgi:hypothetical protein